MWIHRLATASVCLLIILCPGFTRSENSLPDFSSLMGTGSEPEIESSELPPDPVGLDELSEQEVRKKIQESVNRQFVNEEFQKLNNLGDRYRKAQERTPAGTWKLSWIYWGLSDLVKSEQRRTEVWDEHIKRADRWRAKFPDSPTAAVVKGVLLFKKAWSIRGSGFSNSVDEAAWKPFKTAVRRVERYLIQNHKTGSQDPFWYSLYMRVSRAIDWPSSKHLKVFAEGWGLHPNYWHMASQAARAFSPRWGGDNEKFHGFIMRVFNSVPEPQRYSLYSGMYWSANQTEYGYIGFRKGESKVDWEIFKKGIDETLRQYPVQWNIQNFAHFACEAHDFEASRGLLERLEGKAIKKAWHQREDMFKWCYFKSATGKIKGGKTLNNEFLPRMMNSWSK